MSGIYACVNVLSACLRVCSRLIHLSKLSPAASVSLEIAVASRIRNTVHSIDSPALYHNYNVVKTSDAVRLLHNEVSFFSHVFNGFISHIITFWLSMVERDRGLSWMVWYFTVIFSSCVDGWVYVCSFISLSLAVYVLVSEYLCGWACLCAYVCIFV